MNDMTKVIAPKSDQLNSDDLIAGPRVIRIRDVDIRPGTEQPVSMFFDDDNNKPWKPCKSMSRVLVHAWGPDAKVYIGRSVKIYRDPDVTWAGMKVGGIRISHMSHIEREFVIALTATKKTKAVATIKVLQEEAQKDAAADWVATHISGLGQVEDLDGLNQHIEAAKKSVAKLESTRPELHAKVSAAYDIRREMLTPSESRSESDMGEGFNDPETGVA